MTIYSQIKIFRYRYVKIRYIQSRSSALSVNVLLIFEIHDLSGALFLYATAFSALSFPFVAAAKRSIVPFTSVHASL